MRCSPTSGVYIVAGLVACLVVAAPALGQATMPPAPSFLTTAAANLGNGSWLLCAGRRCAVTDANNATREIKGIRKSVTAAAAVADGKVWLFAGTNVQEYDLASDKLGKKRTFRSLALPRKWRKADAAMRWGDAGVVVFSGGQWAAVNLSTHKAAGVASVDDWPAGWPAPLRGKLTAVLSVETPKSRFYTATAFVEFDASSSKFVGHERAPATPRDNPEAEPAPARAATGGGGGGSGGGADAGSSRKPMPSLGASALDLRGPKSTPLQQTDPSGLLSAGDEGIVSFWLRADWTDAHCSTLKRRDGAAWPQYKYIYTNGSVSKARLRVAIHCDRRRLLLEGNGITDRLLLQRDFSDGKPHHVILQTNKRGTTVRVDNQLMGEVPVTYGNVGRVSVFIGANAELDAPFIGVLAGVRVFTKGITAAQADTLKSLDDSALAASPHFAQIVGYMTAVGGRVSFRLKAPALDLAGRWARIQWVDAPQQRVRGDVVGQNDYVPRALVTMVWTTRCSRLAQLAAGVGGGDCNQRVLAILDAYQWAKQPKVRVFERVRGDKFQEVGGSGTLTVERSSNARFSTQVSLDGGRERLVRPDTPPQAEDFTSAWGGGGGVESFDTMSMGFHAKNLDLRFVTSTSTQPPVLAMLPDQIGKRWRKLGGGLAAPFGVYADSSSVSCAGGKTTKVVDKTEELLDEMNNTWGSTKSQETRIGANIGVSTPKGGGGAGFNASWGDSLGQNQGLKNIAHDLQTSKTQMIRQQARCAGHAFFLDPGRLELNDSFRHRVTQLRADLKAGRQDAVQRFVTEVGTHYANAVTFGGIAVLEVKMNQKAADIAKTLATQHGVQESSMWQFDAQASLSVGPVSGGVSGGHTSSKGSDSANAASNMQRLMNQNMTTVTRWETKGGIGGGNFESWTSGGTQVPIYVQLRPITELLAPPFFTDPAIIVDVRVAVDRELQRVLQRFPLANKTFLQSKLLPKVNWGDKCPNFDVDCKAGFSCRDNYGKQELNGQNRCLKPLHAAPDGQDCRHASECTTKRCGFNGKCGAAGNIGGPTPSPETPGCDNGFSLQGGWCRGREQSQMRPSSPPTCPTGFIFNGQSGCKRQGKGGSMYSTCPSGMRNMGTYCEHKNAGKAIGGFFTGKTGKTGCNRTTCPSGYTRSGCRCNAVTSLPRSSLRCSGGGAPQPSRTGNLTCMGRCPNGYSARGSNCVRTGEQRRPKCPQGFSLRGSRCIFAQAAPPKPAPPKPAAGKPATPTRHAPGALNLDAHADLRVSARVGGRAIAGQWRCVRGIDTPVRLAGGHVECAAADGRSCMWGRCRGGRLSGVVSVPNARRPLTCGPDHKRLYRTTGYGQAGHWCAKACRALGCSGR